VFRKREEETFQEETRGQGFYKKKVETAGEKKYITRENEDAVFFQSSYRSKKKKSATLEQPARIRAGTNGSGCCFQLAKRKRQKGRNGSGGLNSKKTKNKEKLWGQRATAVIQKMNRTSYRQGRA